MKMSIRIEIKEDAIKDLYNLVDEQNISSIEDYLMILFQEFLREKELDKYMDVVSVDSGVILLRDKIDVPEVFTRELFKLLNKLVDEGKAKFSMSGYHENYKVGKLNIGYLDSEYLLTISVDD